jgi:hypothetical protein
MLLGLFLDGETVYHAHEVHGALGWCRRSASSRAPAPLSSSVTRLEGGGLGVGNCKGYLTINGAHVSQGDVIAENGVLHAMGQVLVPLDDLGNDRLELSEPMMVAPDAVILVVLDEDSE